MAALLSIAAGERMMREAAQCEAAGNTARAVAKYRVALKRLKTNHPSYSQMIEDKLRALEAPVAPPSSSAAAASSPSKPQSAVVPHRQDKPVTWDDVAGLHEVKALIRRHVELPRKHPHLRIQPHGLSLLLYGPPGTGHHHSNHL
jgi:SpoVK/Ycf46/Vps4 family AAA+-type ATPase